ncbi:MAG: sugar transferase [Coriobacteriia bacterium]|nr:sugar transferase [Coriobacteriia bacterium]
MKQVLDFVIALFVLVILAPLLALVGLAVRIALGAPVIFGQNRPGLHGRIFRLYKFRTMSDARDAGGQLLSDEHRLTRFGKFLRSTSLDELPEFWNVLKGDMSLVGPRPLLVEYLDRYTPEQARRHEVRPGITGLAQVSGRNELPWEERFKLDVWYVDNHTIWLDVKILAMTVWKAVRREGISNPEHATMSKFLGTSDNDGGSACDS